MTNDNKQPDVRAAFEAHQLSRYQYADITRDADGRYWNVPMESEWETWQAALQSPSVANTPQDGKVPIVAEFDTTTDVNRILAEKGLV